ncbi:MAG TPA: hypothetical protein VI756_31325 [Blastocatellia bacterium]
MKPAEMVNVALTYAVTVALTNLILKVLNHNKPGIALIAGAVIATEVAAWSYQKRARKLAPLSVKLFVGGLMAIVCVLQCIAFQALWHWMTSPVVTVIVGAVGSFVVPLLIFGNLQERIVRPRK